MFTQVAKNIRAYPNVQSREEDLRKLFEEENFNHFTKFKDTTYGLSLMYSRIGWIEKGKAWVNH